MTINTKLRNIKLYYIRGFYPFIVDEFVKFHEFNEKLPLHTKVIGLLENITNTYLWLLLVKFTFHLSYLFK